MKNAKQKRTGNKAPNADNPLWLRKLSQVISKLDPAYAWDLFERARQSNQCSRGNEIGEVNVVYSRRPEIVVEVRPGVWSIICSYDPEEAKALQADRRQRQGTRKRRKR